MLLLRVKDLVIFRGKQNSEMIVPDPTVMPVDRVSWGKELHLSNFINTYYQHRDISQLPDCKRILIVGPGQGFDASVLRWRGYEVTTFDIDETFRPDYQGSVHKMDVFCDGQFDVVTASHVLEHFAVPFLDSSLKEIARVGKYALIYLPVAGRHFQVRFIPGVKGIDVSIVKDVFNYFHKPDGLTPRYCGGQHFWEVGMRGFRIRDIMRRLSPFFEILSAYRNRDWILSQNFVLKSRTAR